MHDNYFFDIANLGWFWPTEDTLLFSKKFYLGKCGQDKFLSENENNSEKTDESYDAGCFAIR